MGLKDLVVNFGRKKRRAKPDNVIDEAVVKYWGGFVNGTLDQREIDTGFGGWGTTRVVVPALFKLREDARREYRDVRPVLIMKLALRKPKIKKRSTLRSGHE